MNGLANELVILYVFRHIDNCLNFNTNRLSILYVIENELILLGLIIAGNAGHTRGNTSHRDRHSPRAPFSLSRNMKPNSNLRMKSFTN